MDPLNDADELSPEELAYMESGGRTELPVKAPETPAATDPTPAVESTPAADASKVQSAGTEPAKEVASSDDDDDEIDEGQYVRDAQGRLRDPKTNRFVKMVPIHAVHKAREKHKTTKAELDKLRIDMARGEERLAILNEAFNGNKGQPGTETPSAKKTEEPNPFEEATIDHNQDFVGAFDQMNRRNAWLQKQLQSSQQKTEQFEAQTQQRDAMSMLRHNYQTDVQSFRQATPDFMDAYTHLVKGRLAELEIQGVRDPAKRKAIVESEETHIVATAMQNNQSPAQVIYGIAKARGYVAKPATPATPTTPAANAASPATPPTTTPAAEKLRQIQNGQNAAATLSNVGGQAAPSLTMETLARMNEEEFNAAVDGMTTKQLERMLGGR